ncbi:DUF6602 domain-containing protein [Sphingomonas sp. BK069]|uniref:DUF6602 domain-containing protein n=1 Tax=Sphingomonas sp. BK069 TaxID=2586979 RepID=UPI00160B6320|nr:DUF6602 domain-containing protein [Sphingomonas sp. BK069]MBB3348326.1 hypothetical protein [Sphingomonas sp. BK069]
MPKIDLVREFDNLAADLLRAVDRGRVLHETGNIANSGAPLEHLFRDLVGKRLPEPFRMRTGYLFDAEREVSPQIDAMIVDATTSHEIFRQEDGAGYLPYVSAVAVLEIKNAAGRCAGSIAQIRKIAASIKKMHTRSGVGIEERERRTPLYILVLGTASTNLPELKRALASDEPSPDIIYLIEQGLMLARDDGIFEFSSGHRGFRERMGGDWQIYGPPREHQSRAGWMLQWIYFALLSQIKTFSGNTGIYAEFLNSIERSHSVSNLGKLEAATAWP